ncbi:hypothetical protein GCM10010275_42330 [Streptomyces litmocidini]|nr:hypothetical protein GCM10010275_42330 [Streptomyces litmocidini]
MVFEALLPEERLVRAAAPEPGADGVPPFAGGDGREEVRRPGRVGRVHEDPDRTERTQPTARTTGGPRSAAPHMGMKAVGVPSLRWVGEPALQGAASVNARDRQ